MNFNLTARVNRVKPSPTIAVSSKAEEMKTQGRNIVNLGAGEPDFDTPDFIKEAAISAISTGKTKYTAVGGTTTLKETIVEKFSRENNLSYDLNNIIVSSGAKQCLINLMLAVLEEGDEVIIPAPYWVSYIDMALFVHATPVVVAPDIKTNKITPDILAQAITPKTKLAIFNSPSNPSGKIYTKEEWEALAEVFVKSPHVMIASDDIYEHIRYENHHFSNILNANPDLKERTVVINGVSKSYAMTGWRIGYAAAANPIIKAMTKIQSQTTSNPCSVSQAAAQAALSAGTDCIQPMLEAFDRRRILITSALNNTPGIHCDPIEGAFYAFADANVAIKELFARGKIKAENDLAFSDYLLEVAEIAVVPGSAFGYNNYIRLSFATSDENLVLASKRLQAALL